mmetsp:Transcript_41617/g.89347  ORF Transcript_41617/g.89347 Transcript_41617/m.89347 type:complete len:128 (+) Transcript_41617:125-508(+)|eukprot:CAMPEP_0206500670 /NCGR_PEP_ID=MMETSP0324_2-20121206/52741_1 /ASSEMBLY_ACC=CAM_ASM_000836 /TAXON_ID=2866 /ORGANISM="Crypthecodinium cohnii, Strain Seligo" /LENGTH=127 /DNA_ID=CAMNT_0053988119 /DNA_START=125 /DNA_END=508 /DNA_ORIENTATION=+
MNAAEEQRARQMAASKQGEEMDMQKLQEQRQQMQEMEEQKRVMIRSILDSEALERLNRLGMVKPEKQQQIEMTLIQMARSGQIQDKVSDNMLVQMIERGGAAKASSGIKFQRKRRDDSDDDIDLDNL